MEDKRFGRQTLRGATGSCALDLDAPPYFESNRSEMDATDQVAVSTMLFLQVMTVFLASIAMSLAVAHALELPGKMRLSRESYIATQTTYYPGFTIGGISEGLSIVAAFILLSLTPTNSQAFWWTLALLLAC